MQEPAYLEFRLQQQEKRTLYRCQPRYTFPLKVVENDFGYLIFSGNEIGRNGFRECIRYITDHYFDPHYDTGHLAVYDSTFMDKNLVPLIDAAYKPCKPMELDYSFDFYPASYIGLDELPKEFIDSLKPVCYHSMEATAGDFIKFATDWHFNKDTQVSISRENHDIYRLLTVMRNGYMNIHEQPFTYFNELLPYAKEFEKVTQVKSAGEFDTGKFKRLSTEIRKAADGILKRDFDVRGHRSLENMLNDSTVTFTVGSRKLNEVQKTALASGYALYLPENNKEATRHLLFCKADFEQGRIEGSSKPFGVRTYVIKDGLLCPLPEEKNTVKKTENKNRHNNNRLKYSDMIPKSQMYLGARIVENDPEEETPVVPYKGTVTAIEETGKGELDYFVYIRLDDESMKQKRISLCCPDKIMTCFPWTIDLEEKQKMEQKMKNKKVPDPSKRHRLS